MGTTLWSLALSLVLLVTSASTVRAQEGTRVTVFEAWFIHNESMGAPTGLDHGVGHPIPFRPIPWRAVVD